MAQILIVEDHADMRDIYKTLLERMGHEVHVARDGVEGLHQLRSRPDLVILDLSMPVASGDVVLGFIRSTPELKRIKVVVISALPQAEKLAEQLDADLCLNKPVDLADVKKAVERLLAS